MQSETMLIPKELKLPSKYTSWRTNQADAVERIVKNEKDTFLLDAPTGLGKSLVAIAAYKRLDVMDQVIARMTDDEQRDFRCIYLTRTIQLQEQVLGDFPGKMVKGRRNYPCAQRPAEFRPDDPEHSFSADDCPGKCAMPCEYQIAKNAAAKAPLAVLNDAYYLTEVNGPGLFRGANMVVVDECVPGETVISTPAGDKLIKDLSIGDVVWSYQDGEIIKSIIENVSVRETHESLSNINGLRSTFNHPIWTPEGYKNAVHVTAFDRVGMIRYKLGYDKPYMQTMRANIYPESAQSCVQILHSKMCSGQSQNIITKQDLSSMSKRIPCQLPISEMLFAQMRQLVSEPNKDLSSMSKRIPTKKIKEADILLRELSLSAYDQPTRMGESNSQDAGREKYTGNPGKVTTVSAFKQKPDTPSRNTSESNVSFSCERLQESQWREWARLNSATEDSITFPWLANRIYSRGGAMESCECERTANLLQNRHCRTDSQNSYRSGWDESRFKESQRSGQEKGRIFNFNGLENLTIQEQRNSSQSGNSSSDNNESCTVYNLKTSTGNYFANGLLVHNCDSLESCLMDFIKFTVSERRCERYNLPPPARLDSFKMWISWAQSAIQKISVIQGRMKESLSEEVDQWTDVEIKLNKQIKSTGSFLHQMTIFLNEVNDTWILDLDLRTKAGWQVTFKPVMVGPYCERYLWRHGTRFLGMSGTILEPTIMAQDLGIRDYDYHRLDSTFPVGNRLIHYRPVANLKYDLMEMEKPKMAAEVAKIIQEFKGENVLVHAVSWTLRNYLMEALPGLGIDPGILMTHETDTRAEQLALFKKRKGYTMISPSFDRGIDLPNGECRAVIVAKMPYLSLKDKQVEARMKMPNGQRWYTLKAIQTVMQMTGRANRSEADFSDIFILDRQFDNLLRGTRHYIPKWWLAAIRRE